MQFTGNNDDGGNDAYDRGLYDDDNNGLYDDGQYEDALYDQQAYYDDNGEDEEEDRQYGPSVGGSARQGPPADLVDLLGVDVFDALVRSLLADGRAADAAALCSSSQRARSVCQASRANWARDFPNLRAAYGAPDSWDRPRRHCFPWREYLATMTAVATMTPRDTVSCRQRWRDAAR